MAINEARVVVESLTGDDPKKAPAQALLAEANSYLESGRSFSRRHACKSAAFAFSSSISRANQAKNVAQGTHPPSGKYIR